MKSTSNGRRKAKRVIRPLTGPETERLRRAREAAESARDEILRKGRVAKRAWAATRREVTATLKRLREERERQGLSLADVEERSGLRRAVLSRLENDDGKANPTVLTLQRYAAALGLTVRAIVADAGGS